MSSSCCDEVFALGGCRGCGWVAMGSPNPFGDSEVCHGADRLMDVMGRGSCCCWRGAHGDAVCVLLPLGSGKAPRARGRLSFLAGSGSGKLRWEYFKDSSSHVPHLCWRPSSGALCRDKGEAREGGRCQGKARCLEPGEPSSSNKYLLKREEEREFCPSPHPTPPKIPNHHD